MIISIFVCGFFLFYLLWCEATSLECAVAACSCDSIWLSVFFLFIVFFFIFYCSGAKWHLWNALLLHVPVYIWVFWVYDIYYYSKATSLECAVAACSCNSIWLSVFFWVVFFFFIYCGARRHLWNALLLHVPGIVYVTYPKYSNTDDHILLQLIFWLSVFWNALSLHVPVIVYDYQYFFLWFFYFLFIVVRGDIFGMRCCCMFL